MDFWAPPEITSALIHSGPGPGSLLTAANAWRQLAIELGQTAAAYASTVAGISWEGPSATAMTLSTLPYVAWLNTTAGQAAQMSMAADTMASSFAATQAAVVHPSVVAANRAQLAHLIATNAFGINFPAIAATEAQYVQMWEDNATAMLGYHATSLQTMAMPTFTAPSPMTTPTAPVTQQAAVGGLAAADPAASATSFFADPFVQTVNADLFQVIASGVFNPQSFAALFMSGHDYMPGQYPDVLAPTPRNLAIAYNITGPEAVGGAPNFFAPPAATTSAVQASVTASLGRGMYVGNLVVPPSAVTSPIQLAAQEAPMMATTAEGAPLVPMFVPPMPPGARKAQRDKPNEKGYGPPIFGTIMRRPPSGG
ncbi:PPE family protein [Mycobacterium sp. 663a-19]|uniref:PPE family protein n=1 Tax=Mycobacterium sp. 663a-19 TaxID=2986148 RepID=UPI002D1E898E|nr:PPE family protein [Mycobacterium sp. 663a-19]MEB3984343.1 PPE family protein [Mycobacterium sp. 663a-19]